MAERYMADTITEVEAPKGTEAVPKAFTRAFQGGPAYTTDPTKKPSELVANASLTDEERLQKAQELLGEPLTTEQGEVTEKGKAVLKAHQVGLGERGRHGGEAGVGNYTTRQLGEKIKILKGVGFNKEQWKTLLREGIAGFLAPGVIDLDPATYRDPANPTTNATLLSRFTNEVRRRGDAGQADENYLRAKRDQLSQMYIEGTIDETQALEVLDFLEGWVIEAERPPGPSLFEQTLVNIAELQDPTNSDPDRLTKLDQEVENLNELIRVANEAGLYEGEKSEAFSNLRIGRIDVSIREKKEGSRLRHIAEAKARAYQSTVESEAFWNDPRFPQRRLLRAQLEGAVDYFRRGSAALVESVARDPSRGSQNVFAIRDYSDVRAEFAGFEGIMAAWNYNWKDSRGNDYIANNFEEVRLGLERERWERPRFLRHPWYRNIEFFADNMYELKLAARDFVDYAIANLPKGDSEEMLQHLKQEQSAGQDAFKDAILYFEREAKNPAVKWISSAMNSKFIIALIGFFQRRGVKGQKGFEYGTNSFAEGLRVTDTSINYEDALTLDEDGMFKYIQERLCENDGEFWRFGTNSPRLPTKEEMYAYLERKRAEIIEDAARHRLRSVKDTQNPNYLFRPFDADEPANPLNFVGPIQPDNPFFHVYKALRDLKATYDQIDQQTIAAGGTVATNSWDAYVAQNRGEIPRHRAFAQAKVKCDLKDAKDILDGKNITNRRWDIYKEEAGRWEDFTKTGEDARDPEAKVKFVHPLARSWRSDEEFFDMYEEITDPAEIDRRKKTAEILIKSVEDYLRANMIDVRSGSARIKIREKDAQGNTIRNGRVLRLEVYANILRDELKRTMALDEGRSFIDKRFKVTHVLREMGYRPEMPGYALFALGADDTVRNEGIVKHFEEIPEFREMMAEVDRNVTESDNRVNTYKQALRQQGMSDVQINADPTLQQMLRIKEYVDERLFRGSNAKTIIVKLAEDERLAIQAVQRAVRHPDNRKYGNNGGDYENFPGYDNPFEEGGVKFWKILLYPDYGTSRGTVRINGLIPAINFGVLDRISELGGWTPNYITGLRHRGDEIELEEEGALLIDPKDTQDSLERLLLLVKKRSLWTSAGDAEKKPGMLMGGVFSGMFKLRELGTRNEFWKEEFAPKGSGLPPVIERPEDAFDTSKFLLESGKRALLETMGDIVGPLAAAMRANRELETAYGYAQGTSKNMNTLLINDVFEWMDKYWQEYQGDFGYAVDGILQLSRQIMYIYLKEEGLIWPEKRMGNPAEGITASTMIEGWDTISRRLIKDLPEDLWLGVPVESRLYPAKGSIKANRPGAEDPSYVREKSRYLEAPTRDREQERKAILDQLRAELAKQTGP